MGNEPLWLLFERMRRALLDAARVSARVTERVRQLETPPLDEDSDDKAAGNVPGTDEPPAPGEDRETE